MLKKKKKWIWNSVSFPKCEHHYKTEHRNALYCVCNIEYLSNRHVSILSQFKWRSKWSNLCLIPLPFVCSLCVLAVMSGKVWRGEKVWRSGNITETEQILDHQISINLFKLWNHLNSEQIQITCRFCFDSGMNETQIYQQADDWFQYKSVQTKGISTEQSYLSWCCRQMNWPSLAVVVVNLPGHQAPSAHH